MGIALPVPELLIRNQLGDMPPQVETEPRTDGQPNYLGWAAPGATTSDPFWIVTKYIYTDNQLTHYSSLTGIVWSMRALYNFP